MVWGIKCELVRFTGRGVSLFGGRLGRFLGAVAGWWATGGAAVPTCPVEMRDAPRLAALVACLRVTGEKSSSTFGKLVRMYAAFHADSEIESVVMPRICLICCENRRKRATLSRSSRCVQRTSVRYCRKRLDFFLWVGYRAVPWVGGGAGECIFPRVGGGAGGRPFPWVGGDAGPACALRADERASPCASLAGGFACSLRSRWKSVIEKCRVLWYSIRNDRRRGAPCRSTIPGKPAFSSRKPRVISAATTRSSS